MTGYSDLAASQFDIKGMELNMGYAAYLGRISAEDSAVVTCLLKAGAVVSSNLEHSLFDHAH